VAKLKYLRMKAKIARLYPQHTTIQFKTRIEGVSSADNDV
jgi:hypothetical protein